MKAAHTWEGNKSPQEGPNSPLLPLPQLPFPPPGTEQEPLAGPSMAKSQTKKPKIEQG